MRRASPILLPNVLPIVLALVACAQPARLPTADPNAPLQAAVLAAGPRDVRIALTRPAYVALVVGDSHDPRGPRVILADTGSAGLRAAGEQLLQPTNLEAYARVRRSTAIDNYVLLVASSEPFAAALRASEGGYLFPAGTPRLTDETVVEAKLYDELFAGGDERGVAIVAQSLPVRAIAQHPTFLPGTPSAYPPTGFTDCGNGIVAPNIGTQGGGCAGLLDLRSPAPINRVP